MSLFSGLEKFGLGKLEKMEVFEESAKKDDANGASDRQASAKPQVKEEELLFDKSYECPVCGAEFTSKMIRTGRVKLVSQDTDLRPKHQPVDSLKYDAIACPKCGYAALSRYFKYVTDAQSDLIKNNISNNFKGLPPAGATYTYDDAIERHQLALANAVVKKAKTSEKAYTCLKTAWLYRGKAESLDKSLPDYEKVAGECAKEERSLIENAYDGFSTAFSNEDFPMCGMDELTVTYIMADLARRIGKFEEASRHVSKILTSREASERIKDKARDIKELINEGKK